MPRLNFTGTQDIDGREVSVRGYLQTLSKEEEFRIPVKGIININNQDYSNHNFTGSITQLVLSLPPTITLYTDNGRGMKLYYNLETPELYDEKLIYSGIWCPINEKTLPEIMVLGGIPKISQKVSLEFILKTDKHRILVEGLGVFSD